MLSDETLLLLNRATLTSHTVRTAVHELNNVLQMVSGYAELLQGTPDLPASALKRVDAILRQTGRGQAILQTVTELTRPGEQGARRAVVTRSLERVLESRRYEHTRAGIAVTVDASAADAVRTAMPPQPLEQILLNLVLNAEQAVAGAPAAAITIQLATAGDEIVVSVGDSGQGPAAGIDPLAPFATSRPGVSAGLGLPASRVLAERHGAAIEPFRTADAAGWRVRLPLAPS